MVSIATGYLGDAYFPNKTLCQMWTQYYLEERRYWGSSIVPIATKYLAADSSTLQQASNVPNEFYMI